MEVGMREYIKRWQAVAEIEQQELRTASIELRWRQLNAIIGLAIGLGILESQGKKEVYLKWAKIKEISQPQAM